MRPGDKCECDEGWTGINCNVCTKDDACNKLMPTGDGGVCYQNGDVVNQNYQFCDVTNKKIRELLGTQVPQVTFTCEKATGHCEFQFWVEERESFYCHLSECTSRADFNERQNKTSYECDHVACSCVPGRMLCGEHGSVDIGEFLDEEIRGPASFQCKKTDGGINNCAFTEPKMDELISSMFGDSSITLTCRSGECLYHTEVPGYERPVKKINTPLIAGVIAGASLFVVAVMLGTWYMARRRSQYGPIALDDSDDEGGKLMTDHKPVTLQFENVCYELNNKVILSKARGLARPGEITAIMGASGAGKTTFLDILARKNKRGRVKGSFFVNGETVTDQDFKNVIGFVDQEDTMLPTLTVHETILASALLRLPRDMTRAAKEARVHEIERQLGIHQIRDSVIGSEEGKGRGISGGEKRRVAIACELVTSPSILFLDEPTSGLDAYNAFNVIECLLTLAKTYKRTVVFTIHQPRSNIVALFDRLILLAQGQTVYSGPFAQCQDYFDRLGYSCPPGFNIADYLVDLTMHAAVTSPDDDRSIPFSGHGGGDSEGLSSSNAVKSVASDALPTATSAESSDSPENVPLRPQVRPKDFFRAQQERELFTRRPIEIRLPVSEDIDSTPPPAPNRTELDFIVRAFAASQIAKATQAEMQQSISIASESNGRNNSNGYTPEGPNIQVAGAVGKGYARVSYLRQFIILAQRTWRNLYRNPMLMLTHYAIAILLAVLSGYLFYGLTDDISGFQNRLGLFFFLLALFGFSTLTSLNVFASERLLFVRERANGYYAPLTYFLAKVIFDIIPLRIIPPILMGSIVYPMTGLVPDLHHFSIFLLVLVLFNLAAAAICLFIGIVCKDHGVANLIGSLVMLFSLLFAGLLLNHDKIPDEALWLQSLSIFHYGFESLIVNEVTYLTLVDKKYGLDITVPGAAILSSFGFDNQALGLDILELGMFAIAFIVLAYAAMHILLVEKR